MCVVVVRGAGQIVGRNGGEWADLWGDGGLCIIRIIYISHVIYIYDISNI